MAVTVTRNANNLGSDFVQDTDANNSLTTLSTPTTGSIYLVTVQNPNASPVYFKLADANSGTVGTLAANLVLQASASLGGGIPSTSNFVFPGGVPFTTGFSHWCVTAPAEAAAVSPASAVTASYVIGA